LLQDVNTMHGFGALSLAHTEDDLEKLYVSSQRLGEWISP